MFFLIYPRPRTLGLVPRRVDVHPIVSFPFLWDGGVGVAGPNKPFKKLWENDNVTSSSIERAEEAEQES